MNKDFLFITGPAILIQMNSLGFQILETLTIIAVIMFGIYGAGYFDDR